MKPIRYSRLCATAALAAACAGGATQALAANLCKNKVFLDSIYQVGTGGQNYEYYIQVRNGTDKPLKSAVVTFAGFDNKTVTLFSPRLDLKKPDGPVLGPWMTHQPSIKFGTGTAFNIVVGVGVVALYDKDQPVQGKAAVRVTDCVY